MNNRIRRQSNSNAQQRMAASRASMERQQTKLLKQLVQYQAQSKMLPSVKDVDPLPLRRDKVYSFSKLTRSSAILAQPDTESTYGFSFSLDQIPDYEILASNFDQYRIVQVRAFFRNTVSFPLTLDPNFVVSAIDYNDASGQTTFFLRQYGSAQINATDEDWSRTLTPRVNLSAGTPSTPVATAANVWLNTDSPSIPYYGLKVAAGSGAAGSAATTIGTITFEFIVQFRNSQ